ncbi:MAG: aspartate carbamoyltransferase [Methylomonas sp.]
MKASPLFFIVLLVFSWATLAEEKADPKHLEEVRQRTQIVVPFSVDETLQTFTKTVHGGIQHVVTKSPDNTRQIKLIQDHLKKIAEEFRKGDFSVTERMHGSDTPGLARLKRAATDDIRYEYKPLPNGAQIHYSSEYPELVQALHEWFDAQATEHGNDNIPDHAQHHSKPTD